MHAGPGSLGILTEPTQGFGARHVLIVSSQKGNVFSDLCGLEAIHPTA